jgi:peptide/nickel transport system substrate-binding protein
MCTILKRSCWSVMFVVIFIAIPALAQDQPKRGGTVIVAVWQEPENLNRALRGAGIRNTITDFVVEGLIDVDDKGENYPVLAEQVPTVGNGGVSPDGKTVIYKLKKGVSWSDGSLFTCEDVQFTYKVNVAPGALTPRIYQNIQSVDCPDPFTAIIKWENFYAPYIQVFGTIFPRSAGDPAKPASWGYTNKPLGTGPFKVDEFVKGDHVTLSRNENFREPGKPYLDKIIVRILPSRENALQLLKTGQADVALGLTEADIPDVENMAGVRLSSAPSSGGERMYLNLVKPGEPADNKVPHPILGDLRVRQAIAYGINKQRIVDRLLGGRCPLGTTDLNIDPCNCSDIKPWPYDPAKARQLLEEAGWMVGPDGIRIKDGLRLRLKLQAVTGDKVREDSEMLMAEDMKAIGVEFYIDNQSLPYLWGTWTGSPVRRGNFDIVMLAASFPTPDPGMFMGSYLSIQIPSPENQSGANFTRWNDPETDRLLREANSIPDWPKRMEFYCKVAARTFEGISQIHLYQRMNLNAYRDRLQGWIPTTWGTIGWNAEDWWVK